MCIVISEITWNLRSYPKFYRIEFPDPQLWQNNLFEKSQDTAYAEGVFVHCTARLLNVRIDISLDWCTVAEPYTSINHELPTVATILLGSLSNSHYQSLIPSNVVPLYNNDDLGVDFNVSSNFNPQFENVAPIKMHDERDRVKAAVTKCRTNETAEKAQQRRREDAAAKKKARAKESSEEALSRTSKDSQAKKRSLEDKGEDEKNKRRRSVTNTRSNELPQQTTRRPHNERLRHQYRSQRMQNKNQKF